MFNGYNETPLISYDLNQERTDKKQENAPKWSYGHEPGVQPAQSHPSNRQPEFWSNKPGFAGLPNVVKCNCTGCYPSSENQSYHSDTTRHRPWLPQTFPVPLNGSNESCKLPACQWDNSITQNSCYPEGNVSFVQENGGKQAFCRQYQESRLPESSHPGVITSLKNAEFGKKQKEETSLQNVMRQPVFSNPIYNLTKRADGRNYCDPNKKYSNAASFSVDQQIPRLPVVEPFIKSVPSNLSQTRVPSTGYRSVKENVSQSYLDSKYGHSQKMCHEPNIGGDKSNESFFSGALPTGSHLDYSPLSEAESQKLFLDNVRHSDYYSRRNFQDVLNRNSQDNRKDCVITQIDQMNFSEQYKAARSKYQEAEKLSCETYYPKDFEKARTENHLLESSACFERNEDKNENMNVHARLTRPALIFNDPRFADRTQNAFPYQNNLVYKNHARPEYPYQSYNVQNRFEYPAEISRNDFGQCRTVPQQMQTCEQFTFQQGNGFIYDSPCQQNADKAAQFYEEKATPIMLDSMTTSLEAIRSERVNKNGTSKISPLRLLRKKKFINLPQEPSPSASTLDVTPGLDVRKFWSTWAEEEEENMPSTQMVVLDCQNIDPAQAKLLNLCGTDPVRAVELETGSIVLNGMKEPESLSLNEVPTPQEALNIESKKNTITNNELTKSQEGNTNTFEENISTSFAESESKSALVESVVKITSPSRLKIGTVKVGQENREEKRNEIMDKWTEKKFVFLKRAEESKAAEILRHEEEKKKIFETRLSLQQSLKKIERSQEKVTNSCERKAESLSPFDENSQSSSPENGNGDISNLPTSEYRRNKFLDYSNRKLISSASEKDKEEKNATEMSALGEIKKEDIKLGKTNSTEKFPPLSNKVKDEPCFEMVDILQKMSEMHFQRKEVKVENETRDLVLKKSRGSAKKVKEKKSDHQIDDQKTDKLTLETVKFSIQKSHDLKISFKVLNNSKKCSDEELDSKDKEAEGTPQEDSKNSTELITLKYKSIQRDGSRMLESKKSRRRIRRKKNTSNERTPVLKIKKSRYMPQSERDPLGTYEDEGNDSNVPKVTYSDEYSTSNDFHVHETIDSAKIKLTFKRHKTNFATQYKINNVADLSKVEPVCEEEEGKTMKSKFKKPWRAKEDMIFAEAGVQSFQDDPNDDEDSDAESVSKEHALVTVVEEGVNNIPVSQDSYSEEENYVLESTTEIATALDDGFYDKDEVKLKSVQENLKRFEEKVEDVYESDQKEVEVIASNRQESKEFLLSSYSSENSKESTCGEAEDRKKKEKDFESAKSQEISLDFIRSANLSEIETDHKSERTAGCDTPREENNVETWEENSNLESFQNSKINYSEVRESSYECDNEKLQTKNLKEWEKTSVQGVINVQNVDSLNDTNPPKNAQASLPPILSNDNIVTNCATNEQPNKIFSALTENISDSSRLTHKNTKEDFDMLCISDDTSEDVMEKESKLFPIQLPSADVSSNPSEAVVSDETNASANECEKLSNKQQFETAEDDQLSLNNDKSFEFNNALGLQMSPGGRNSEVQTCPERMCSKEVLMNPESTVSEETQMKIEGNGPEVVHLRPEKVSYEEILMNIEETNPESVEINTEEKNPDTAEKSSKEISPKSVKMSIEKTDLESIEMSLEEINFETSQPEACSHFKNGVPQKKTSEVISFDDSILIEKTNCGISKLDFEEVVEEFSSENVLPKQNDCTFSFGDKSTVTDLENNAFVHMNKTEENSEADLEIEVKDSQRQLLGETSRSEGTNSLLLHCNKSFRDCHVQLEHVQNQTDLSHVELEEGEIIDSSDEEKSLPENMQNLKKITPVENNKVSRKNINFMNRRIKRRHSTDSKMSVSEKEFHFDTGLRKNFSRLKSCPPEFKFMEKECKELGVALDVLVEEIPLPIGPPPHYSCFDLKNYYGVIQVRSCQTEAKEKPEESIFPEPLQVTQKEFHSKTVFGTSDLQNGRNLFCNDETSHQLGLLHRSTKIKFSFSKRSKFSKLVLKNSNANLNVFSQSNTKVPKKEEVCADYKTVEKNETDCEKGVTPEEHPNEQVLKAKVCNETEEPKNNGENLEERENGFQPPVDFLNEDLEENIEVGEMSNYMRDEFYECEDIPTSEDLTNGDDLEMEKVNDDKFRNIMQNCLDNAKKFLNVGNLKLFSCSVDDLLELDCQASDSALEEQEPHPNHISRDVLLTSCEEFNDDLGLSENTQPPDLSMDFIPSFCSDVCPEILPVDNWPYLEEEVPSSPTKSKQDETDLIPSLETSSSNYSADHHHQIHTKNGIDRRKLVISESCFKRFRRRSLMSDGEAIRICSKIGSQRRNTVNSFSGVPCVSEICDIKTEIMRCKNGKNSTEKQSLKCRLNLDKLKSKHGVNFGLKNEKMRRLSEGSLKGKVKKKNEQSLDFKSSSWQPKVMLLRISKNELKKVQKESKHRIRLEPKINENFGKREVSNKIANQDIPTTKRPRQESDVERVYVNLTHEGKEVDLGSEREDGLVALSGLESIKGSLSVIASTDERRRKKLRFRNLHTKRKSDAAKDEDASSQTFPPVNPTLVENALTEMFSNGDRMSDSQAKTAKQIDEKIKNSSETPISECDAQAPNEGKHEKRNREHREERKHREKKKEASHQERRREKREQHDQHRDRRKEGDKSRSKHGSSHQQKHSKHFRRSTSDQSDESKQSNKEKSNFNSGRDTPKGHPETSPENSWFCEVCGFDNPEERITHIKNHPFHCQSCHLAFKTEAYFVNHLTKKHKNIRNQHHCLLCELSFDTEEQYQRHLETREHRHLELVEKNTINTLFMLLTGAPCPVLGLVEMKPEWLPNQAGTVHFYHQATPLSLALQVLPQVMDSQHVCMLTMQLRSDSLCV